MNKRHEPVGEFSFFPTDRGTLLFAAFFAACAEGVLRADFFRQFSHQTQGFILATSCVSLFLFTFLSTTRLAVLNERIVYAPHGFLGRRRAIPYPQIAEARVVVAEAYERLELELVDGAVLRVAKCATISSRRLGFHNKAIAARSAVRESLATFRQSPRGRGREGYPAR